MMAGEWIEWGGGQCPVSPDTKVNWRLRGESLEQASNGNAMQAVHLLWAHGMGCDIIAYRIVENNNG